MPSGTCGPLVRLFPSLFSFGIICPGISHETQDRRMRPWVSFLSSVRKPNLRRQLNTTTSPRVASSSTRIHMPVEVSEIPTLRNLYDDKKIHPPNQNEIYFKPSENLLNRVSLMYVHFDSGHISGRVNKIHCFDSSKAGRYHQAQSRCDCERSKQKPAG